jgi:hypothetical protein
MHLFLVRKRERERESTCSCVLWFKIQGFQEAPISADVDNQGLLQMFHMRHLVTPAPVHPISAMLTTNVSFRSSVGSTSRHAAIVLARIRNPFGYD